MKKDNIINQFKNGTLLLKVISELDFFFSIDYNSKLISSKKCDIKLKEKNITIKNDKIVYYLDDSFFLNRFIITKSVFKNLNLKIPDNIDKDIDKESIIILVNEVIKNYGIIIKNLELFPKFLKSLKEKKGEEYYDYFMESLNKFLKENIAIISEKDQDKINNLKKFAEKVLKEGQKIELVKPDFFLKNSVFQLTIYQNLNEIKPIEEYYNKYNNEFRFLRCLGGAFNQISDQNDIDIKFEEGSEFIL